MRWITRAYLSPLRNFLFPSSGGPYNGEAGGPGYGVDNWQTETGGVWLTETGDAWLLD